MTTILNFNREGLLDVLPKHSLVAEIGVYRAEFSKKILEKTQPLNLFLIDPWKTMLDGENIDLQFESFYQEVKNKFKDNTNVFVIRKTSSEAADAITSLDWVYIDADHHYEPCLNDLRTYAPKVKENGYICGHDWVTKPKNGFGVNDAVNQFVKENNYILVGLTNEDNFKSYIIAKTKQAAEKLIS